MTARKNLHSLRVKRRGRHVKWRGHNVALRHATLRRSLGFIDSHQKNARQYFTPVGVIKRSVRSSYSADPISKSLPKDLLILGFFPILVLDDHGLPEDPFAGCTLEENPDKNQRAREITDHEGFHINPVEHS